MTRERVSARARRAWWLRRARRSRRSSLFFFVPVARVARLLSLTDFDIYAVAEPRQPALRRARRTTRACSTTRSSGWRCATPSYFVARRRARSRSASRSARRCCSTRALVRCKALFRTLLFLPVVTTLVAVAVVWRYLYHPRFGLLNHALGALGIAPIDWLGDPRLGDAGDHPHGGLEELRLQHGDLPRRAAERFPSGSTRRRSIDGASPLAAVPPRHAADAGADLALRRS